MSTLTTGVRFREQTITFANGATGRVVDVPSASPRNYHQAVSKPGEMPRITIDGQLFLPPGASARLPLVIIVPGSLGVAPVHLTHAETLTSAGLAAFVLDPFGARGVTSTVTNQTQYSFAASAYDVLAAWQVLAQRPEIDATRIGAQGHSRGGAAVLTAATRRFADAVLGRGRGLAAVLGAYPWSGHQFLDPARRRHQDPRADGRSRRVVLAAAGAGALQAMRLAGGQATLAHLLRRRATASIAAPRSCESTTPPSRRARPPPISPTTAPASTRSTGLPDPALTDRDVAVYTA